MNSPSVFLLGLLPLLLSQLSPESDRLVEMSPNAVAMVETVASAMLGHVEFIYERDESTALFTRGLRSLTASCVPPGTTNSAEEERIAREARERQVLGSRIAPIADLDSSGFVSDEESVQFRMSIETVLMARALSDEQQRPVTIAQLAAAVGSPESTVVQRVALYRDIQPKLARLSPGSPMGLALTPVSETALHDR